MLCKHGTDSAERCCECEREGIPKLPVDKIVSGNLTAAFGHLYCAICQILAITEELIDANDARNINLRGHLDDALKYINEGKCR